MVIPIDEHEYRLTKAVAQVKLITGFTTIILGMCLGGIITLYLCNEKPRQQYEEAVKEYKEFKDEKHTNEHGKGWT